MTSTLTCIINVIHSFPYSSVGYSEDEALEKFGKDNIEIYHKSFIPLEWSISESRSHQGFTKVIVDNSTDKVLGIHFLGPSAGEVMQVSSSLSV